MKKTALTLFALLSLYMAKAQCHAQFTWVTDELELTCLNYTQTGTETEFTWLVDGQIVSHDFDLVTNLPAYGNYEVCLQMVDEERCESEICLNIVADSASQPAVSECFADFTADFDELTGTFTSNVSATGGVSYYWTFSDGNYSELMNPVYPFTNSGSHEVCLTIEDAAGCTCTVCDDVLIEVTAVENEMVDGHIAIYPNPGKESKLQVYTDDFGKAVVYVCDLAGNVMNQRVVMLQHGNNVVDFGASDLAEGSYIVHVLQRNRKEARTFKYLRQ